jgi:hypothetical protein
MILTYQRFTVILSLATIFMIAGLYAWIFVAGIQSKQDQEIKLLNAIVANQKISQHIMNDTRVGYSTP